jgi:GPH family glycoside/pentoside/hexuronide:cation symporter
MSEHYEAVTNQLEKVPMGQKIAFGIGMLANQMFPAALGIFMVVLVKDLGFPPLLWGLAFFLPRIFDALTDPIMGFISDNTKSRWGRRRQYVLLGAVVMGISYILMWQLHKENSLTYNFVYFMSFSFLFYLGLTIFSVPYVAMGYEMSSDFHERTRIMAVAQWIGQWAWVISPWFWVIIYKPEWFVSPAAGCRQLSVWVGLICMGFAVVPALFIKSTSTIDADHLQELSRNNIKENVAKFFKGFADAFNIIEFRRLCVSTFFIFNSFNTIAAFSFFIIVYHLFGGDAGSAGVWPTLFGSIGALATTFLVIPLVSRVSQKIGKKKTFIISQSISIIGYILFWFLFIPGKPYLFIIALPFFSFGIGGLFTLMMSMTADVCDLDELNTGQRREGVFGAIFWWMVKFGFAIAGLLSGLIMTIVHFTPDAPFQPEGAITGMRIFYSVLPIAGTIAAILVMWNYDLSEERANKIRKELEERHRVDGNA